MTVLINPLVQIKKSMTLIYLIEKMADTLTLIRGHKLKCGLKLRQQASLIYNKWSSLRDRFSRWRRKGKKRIIPSRAGPKYDRHP